MGRPAIDYTGKRIGMLTVIKRAEGPSGAGKHARWLCKCDCGNTITVLSSSLKAGQQSCGCKLVTDHYIHGGTKTRLFGVWNSMKQRCTNPNVKEFKHYGARGIHVCEEWVRSFESFRDWAIENGYDETAPRGTCTIDRIDNDGNYSPDNCRVVDMKMQCANRRRPKNWK